MIDQIFEKASLPWLVAAAIAALVLSRVARYVQEAKKIRQLAGYAVKRPTWLPFGADFIWGSVKAGMEDDNIWWWHYNFMKYGNPANPYNFEVYAGGERVIVTADPENIKAVLATQFNDFGKGENFNKDWHEFLGDGIFTTDGHKWHDSRQLIRPQFIKDRVSDLEVFERHTSILLSLMGGQGQVVDAKDLFFRLTLDAATDFLLGRSVESLKQSQSSFAYAFAEVQRVQSIISRAGPLNWMIPRKTFRAHLKTLNSFVDPYIDHALSLSPDELEKRSNSTEGYTFLHAIASYTRDRSVLRDQLINILLAGRDTTACTLSWLFYELSRNENIVRLLREEIGSTVGWERRPTYVDLKGMKHLQYSLNETLRLYPVVPYNVRLALRDTTLPHGGGPDGNSPIGIMKDTPVGYSTHYMQLRPDIYPPTSATFAPPEVFDPGRWYNWQPKHWTYIPFNGGPRICVGQQFALTEMGYVTVRVLQKFARIENKCEKPSSLGVKASGMDVTASEKGEAGKGGEVEKGKWYACREGDGSVPSGVEKVVAGRSEVGMKSEIVLQPAHKVKLAFHEA